ncbi:MAG: hypothetical protein AB2660_14355 [Candidatus Thiodiazotropha sp.]
MSGLLSQALTNVQDTESHLKSLKGLPTAATPIQNQSIELISKAVPIIKQLQSDVKKFVLFAKHEIDKDLSYLKGTSPLSETETLILEVKKGAAQLSEQVSNIAKQISDLSSEVTGFATSLYKIESEINHQKAAIQGMLNKAIEKENAANKKYLYLLALGPFGLVGLATAFGLYAELKSEADGYAKQVSAHSSQISRLSSMVNATTQLASDFVDLSSKTQDLKNGINFLAGDILEILKDTGSNNEHRKTIIVLLIATQAEINSLSADAA